MRQPYKIAILVCGEIRTWNDGAADSLFNLIKSIESEYISSEGKIDIFGHTWSHCDTTNIKFSDKFKHIQIDDQSMIDEWVLEDMLLRGAWSPEYTNKFTNDDDNIKKLLTTSRWAYAQIFGFCLGLKHVVDDYDFLIKVRWDLTFNQTKETLNELFDNLTAFRKHSAIFLSYPTQITYLDNSIGLQDLAVIRVQDNYFVLNRQSLKSITEQNNVIGITTIMDKIIRGSLKDETRHTHYLWALFFGYFSRKIGLSIYTALPNIGSILRSQNEPQSKDSNRNPTRIKGT